MVINEFVSDKELKAPQTHFLSLIHTKRCETNLCIRRELSQQLFVYMVSMRSIRRSILFKFLCIQWKSHQFISLSVTQARRHLHLFSPLGFPSSHDILCFCSIFLHQFTVSFFSLTFSPSPRHPSYSTRSSSTCAHERVQPNFLLH
ncbi:hypothetical protein ILYODFUR_018880 [Ilyodon furcidens]|uniref:Uncharacterized protein n=1 Tax=Ilyodon furcidens TaxID=33524 RepID=A0ABV0V5V8_9TELE